MKNELKVCDCLFLLMGFSIDMVGEMVFNQNKKFYPELGFRTKYSLALKIIHPGLLGGVISIISLASA